MRPACRAPACCSWSPAPGPARLLCCYTGSIRVEPFPVVIRCTSDPDKVDGKRRSKWSRALRVAEAFKARDTSAKAFIKGQGGLNRCAARVREIAWRRG
jgi:hypothetical protein